MDIRKEVKVHEDSKQEEFVSLGAKNAARLLLTELLQAYYADYTKWDAPIYLNWSRILEDDYRTKKFDKKQKIGDNSGNYLVYECASPQAREELEDILSTRLLVKGLASRNEPKLQNILGIEISELIKALLSTEVARLLNDIESEEAYERADTTMLALEKILAKGYVNPSSLYSLKKSPACRNLVELVESQGLTK